MGNSKSIFTGILKGAAAGLAATFVMDRVSQFIYDRQAPTTLVREKLARIEGKDPAHALVNKAARRLDIDFHLGEPHIAGLAVHYGIGKASGMAYSLLRDRVRWLGKSRGLVFGVTSFVLVDQVLNPLMGVARGPTAYPLTTHARGLAGHLAFGVSADMALRGLDRVEDRLRKKRLESEQEEEEEPLYWETNLYSKTSRA